ncbi:MAG: SIMPL domain-containing protein [Anaerolineae bacterium]|nr:SIMPL domain-containing protein [Anaerolineae bacterium]
MLKRIAVTAVTLALVTSIAWVGVWLWGQMASPAAAQTSAESAPVHDPAQTITVVGQGSERIEPDIARVSVGVETSAETVSEAVAENASQMEAILAALKDIGIADKDIQTTNYSVYMERYPESVALAVGPEPGEAKALYRVSNMVNVIIRDLDKVSAVLDGVIAAGANNIWGVSFGLDDPETARAEARAKAMADARKRAEALAELSQVKLGPVMAVSEVIGGNMYPAAVAVEHAAMAWGGGAISPGEVEVSYQVQVIYFIER